MKIAECLFCVSDNVEIRRLSDDDLHRHIGVCYIQCLECGAGGPIKSTEEEAIKEWNAVWNAR